MYKIRIGSENQRDWARARSEARERQSAIHNYLISGALLMLRLARALGNVPQW